MRPRNVGVGNRKSTEASWISSSGRRVLHYMVPLTGEEPLCNSRSLIAVVRDLPLAKVEQKPTTVERGKKRCGRPWQSRWQRRSSRSSSRSRDANKRRSEKWSGSEERPKMRSGALRKRRPEKLKRSGLFCRMVKRPLREKLPNVRHRHKLPRPKQKWGFRPSHRRLRPTLAMALGHLQVPGNLTSTMGAMPMAGGEVAHLLKLLTTVSLSRSLCRPLPSRLAPGRIYLGVLSLSALPLHSWPRLRHRSRSCSQAQQPLMRRMSF
mmetsp:Transcript_46192/g.109869  ORF Transcript_46192/g.109869 Transcript_46192/m.109869 type:complete len:265 (-) Transcript_46192:299-1093(-)